MSYRIVDGGVLVLEEAAENLKDIDAIILDCDGTLVETSSSFQVAGKVILMAYLDQLYDVECRLGDDFDEAFHLLKMLGGFNSVRTVIVVLLQALFINAEAGKPKKQTLEKIDLEYYVSQLIRGKSRPKFAERAFQWIVSEGVKMLGCHVRRADLELLIEEKAKNLGKLEGLKELRKLIGPLFPYGSGMLTTLFSELWLGSEGIWKKHGVKPRFYEGPGLIENEQLIVEPETIEELKQIAFKGLAILSGRGRWEILKILNPIIDYFRVDASVFTGDKPMRIEKPNPAGLIECCEKLGASRILYVGDGGEDLFLTREASKRGVKAYMAGVLTNKYSYTLFTKQKAEAILEDINLLPKLFKQL